MKLSLDSAHLPHIEEIASWGVLEGLTTNPSLLAKEGGLNLKSHVQKICKLVKGPVSVEVTAEDAAGMVKQGREFAKWAKNVAVKLPMTVEGLKACRNLSDDGILVNVTLIFSANQALLAAKAGAGIISVFVGRLDDDGQNGLDVLDEVVQLVHGHHFNAEVLAASIRHPRHVTESALIGADIVTIPYEVFKKLPLHPKTEKGLADFLTDWHKVHGA